MILFSVSLRQVLRTLQVRLLVAGFLLRRVEQAAMAHWRRVSRSAFSSGVSLARMAAFSSGVALAPAPERRSGPGCRLRQRFRLRLPQPRSSFSCQWSFPVCRTKAGHAPLQAFLPANAPKCDRRRGGTAAGALAATLKSTKPLPYPEHERGTRCPKRGRCRRQERLHRAGTGRRGHLRPLPGGLLP